jgi:YNFM family putative membrane transporter
LAFSPAPASPPALTRPILLLALASFASQSMVRVTDSLLPQIAADVGTTVGTASIVVTAYAITHGGVQLIVGPLGDRFGKFRTVTLACGLCALTVVLCALAKTLGTLAAARLASGAAAAWIVPLSMAFVGDVIPYERRQAVLGRYLSGQIAGQLFGQAAGGILGDLFGWRGVFVVLAGLFALVCIALLFELATNPLMTRDSPRPHLQGRSLLTDYKLVLGDPWARTILFCVMIEAGLAYGVFAFVGADLHVRFGLNFTLVGVVVATFGLGGLLYAALVHRLVAHFGQPGLALYGGLLMSASYVGLAVTPVWWLAPVAVTGLGLGFYMLHNTMQTHATQMAPDARGTSLAIFASSFISDRSWRFRSPRKWSTAPAHRRYS